MDLIISAFNIRNRYPRVPRYLVLTDAPLYFHGLLSNFAAGLAVQGWPPPFNQLALPTLSSTAHQYLNSLH